MEDIQRLLEMGRYAQFVWPAYIVTAGVMFGLYFATRRNLKRLRTLRNTLENRESNEET